MNPVQRLFDAQRRHFEENGRFHALYPFFESMETVFYAPDRVTRTGPQVRDSLDVKRYMALVIVSLLPLLFFGIYNTGYQSLSNAGLPVGLAAVVLNGAAIVLPLVAVSYGVGFFWEIVFAVKRNHGISEGLFVTAMLFPLTLPPTTPLWQAALGISFGIVIGKEVFGGTGRNFLNPALTGRAFLFFSYPVSMSGDTVWTAAPVFGGAGVDMVSGATPLALSAGTQTPADVAAVLADSGYTFSTLFLGRYPGSIGATSALLCLAAALFLVVIGIASYRIIVGGIIGVLGTGFLLNLLATDASVPFLSLNPLYHLVMGGAAFGIVFMATDPVSGPDMNSAKWCYGMAIGALTVVIRVFNPAFPEGVMLAILFMNLFAPLFDHIALMVRLKKRIPHV